jgi:hypothetical protein
VDQVGAIAEEEQLAIRAYCQPYRLEWESRRFPGCAIIDEPMAETRSKGGPSEPSVQTIKRLFGQSGNLCAFPNCTQPLISGSTVLGKACHIKGRRPGSPRYDAMQDNEERHGYDNLILMCGAHHDVIDSDEKSYTVERLHEIKSTHLEKAAQLSDETSEYGALLLFSKSAVSINQSGGITANSVVVNNFGVISHNDQGKIFAKPAFPAAQPQEGSARFRKSTEPLGISWNQFIRPNAQQFDVTLADGKALWLRLIPVEASKLEFGPLDLKDAATRGKLSLLPLVEMSVGFLIAEEGIGVYNQVDPAQAQVTNGVAFAFITGEVWSIDTILLNFDDKIYFDEIATNLVKRLRDYADFLNNLGIEAPYRWIAGIEGVSRMKLSFAGQGQFATHFGGPICLSDTVMEGGLYDGKEDATTALSTFFDKIFKKSGARRPSSA